MHQNKFLIVQIVLGNKRFPDSDSEINVQKFLETCSEVLIVKYDSGASGTDTLNAQRPALLMHHCVNSV